LGKKELQNEELVGPKEGSTGLTLIKIKRALLSITLAVFVIDKTARIGYQR